MIGTITGEQKITKLIRKEVIDVVREILSDPDAGLELSHDIQRRLRRSKRSKNAGNTKPLTALFARYGI